MAEQERPSQVELLVDSLNKVSSHAFEVHMALIEENAKLMKALEFYAEKETWDYPGQHHYDAPAHEDQGKVARVALGKEGADDGRAD